MFSGWELAFGLGAFALLLTLAYGAYESRHTSAAANRLGEEGAKRIYDDPVETERPPQGGPRRKVPPLVWIMVGLLVAWLAFIFIMGEEVDNRAAPAAPSSASAEEIIP